MVKSLSSGIALTMAILTSVYLYDTVILGEERTEGQRRGGSGHRVEIAG